MTFFFPKKKRKEKRKAFLGFL